MKKYEDTNITVIEKWIREPPDKGCGIQGSNFGIQSFIKYWRRREV